MSSSKTSTAVDRILFATNPQRVLAFFLSHPTETFYDREVARRTRISRAGTNFSLRDLAGVGLLRKEKKGRMLFYSLAEQSVLIRHLKIVQSIVRLRPMLGLIKTDALRVVLYGSAAKGDNTIDSDLDLFVLTRSKEDMAKLLHNFVAEIRLQPVIHTPQEWARIRQENPTFVNIVEQGIVLWESHVS